MPLYLAYMGNEGVGLIGVFLLLQAMLQLLDLGLSPTMSREMSRYRAGVVSADIIWLRLRSLEWMLALLALLAIALFVMSREYVSQMWFSFERLTPQQVAACFAAMAAAAALRWLAGLYRASLIGLERQNWVNGSGVLFATLKFVGVLPVLVFYSSAPLAFFVYQLVVGAMELLAFRWRVYSVLPGSPKYWFARWNALREMLPMAGAMGFLTGMWIFMTQVDKLVLSKLLTLHEYGIFTLVAALSGGLLAMIPPLNQVLQPRLTILAEKRLHDDLQNLYRLASQAATAVFVSVGGGMALFAQPLFLAWTGDQAVAESASPMLFWYGLANALLGVLIMPYMLQFAYGQLRLHIIGNLVLAITMLPALVYASMNYGAIGAGAVLLLARLSFLFFWVPRVHKKFLPELIVKWPLHDIAPVLAAVMGVLLLANYWSPEWGNRFAAIAFVVVVTLAAMLAGFCAGSQTRSRMPQILGFNR